MERCLACEADGKQGRCRYKASPFSTLIGLIEDLDPQMIEQQRGPGTGENNFPLLTIGLASEATLHGWRPPLISYLSPLTSDFSPALTLRRAAELLLRYCWSRVVQGLGAEMRLFPLVDQIL